MYKRQPFIKVADRLKRKGQQGREAVDFGSVPLGLPEAVGGEHEGDARQLAGLVAVSYTHLDVYKRQEQKYIYYACGETVERIAALPQIELLKEKGYEILYLTDDVDEFALTMLHEYDGKEFKSASSGDLDPVSYTHLPTKIKKQTKVQSNP